MSEPQCVGYGGVFMGNGTLCDPNPCVSGVEDEAQITSLHLAATPNPSTRQVMIRYSLPKPTAVTIEVFNAAGALVRRIDEGMRQAGQHSVSWDGRNGNGDALPSGVYVARMLTLEGTTTGRVVLAR
jgi:flagellar hook assembly protein FlgD